MPAALSIYCRGLWSGPIRAAQGFGPWGHVASVLSNGRTTVEALAMRGGVVQSTVADLLSRSTAYECVSIDLSDEQMHARDAWLLDQIGAGYDYLGAVGGAWLGLRDWQSPSRWYCSELDTGSLVRVGAIRLSSHMRGVTPMRGQYLAIAAGARVVPLAA